jgi:hypothetical protein
MQVSRNDFDPVLINEMFGQIAAEIADDSVAVHSGSLSYNVKDQLSRQNRVGRKAKCSFIRPFSYKLKYITNEDTKTGQNFLIFFLNL